MKAAGARVQGSGFPSLSCGCCYKELALEGIRVKWGVWDNRKINQFL